MLLPQQTREECLIVKNTFLHLLEVPGVCEETSTDKFDTWPLRTKRQRSASDPVQRVEVAMRNLSPTQSADDADVMFAKDFVSNTESGPSPLLTEHFAPAVCATPQSSSILLSASKSGRGGWPTFPVLDGNEEEIDTDPETVPAPLRCYSHIVDIESERDTDGVARCRSPDAWDCDLRFPTGAELGGECAMLELEQGCLGEESDHVRPRWDLMFATSCAHWGACGSIVLTSVQVGEVQSIPSARDPSGPAVVSRELIRAHSRPRSRRQPTLQLNQLVDAVAGKAMPEAEWKQQQQQQLHQQAMPQQPSMVVLLQQQEHEQQPQQCQQLQLRHKGHQEQQQRISRKTSISRKYPLAIEPCDPTWTTLMMRNIPNNYTREMLLVTFCNEGFVGMYDFVYLPMDFTTSAALGYAFVNLITHDAAKQFWRHFFGYSKWSISSKKSCEVSWCQPYQGLAANIERYRDNSVLHPSVPDGHKPQIFSAGDVVDFPPPTKTIRAPRVRGSRS